MTSRLAKVNTGPKAPKISMAPKGPYEGGRRGKIKPAALPGLTGSDTAVHAWTYQRRGSNARRCAPASAKQFKPGIKLP